MPDVTFTIEEPTFNIDLYSNPEVFDQLRLYDDASIAIASGVIAATGPVITAQAETGTTDSLDSITTKVGLLLIKADTGDTITMTHGTSANSISTRDGSSLVLSATGYTPLYRKTTSQPWRVLGDGGGGASDHGTLTGLSDDDHTIYLLLTGRSGGQTVIGGTAASNNLNLQSTSHGTKGQITVGSGETVTIDDATGNTYIGGTLDVQGSVQFAGGPFVTSSIVSTAQLTGDQDNYNPTGFTAATVVRLTSDASRNITGMVGTSDEIKILQNVGSNNIVLKDESASSTAANRFALTADVTLSPDSIVILFYDSTSTRWRVLSAGGGGSSTKEIRVTFDNEPDVLTTGTTGMYYTTPVAGTITGWYINSNATGSVVVDVWFNASGVPTNSDSIAGSEKPTLSSAQQNSDTSLSTWTAAFTAGGTFGFEIESASTVKRVVLTIVYTES